MAQAYAILHIKALDAERRVFSGIATTPDLDRQGHVVDPTGVTFTNPLPLLLHHDAERPVGRVTFQPPTVAGIAFEASMPVIDEPGVVKNRVDEAWHSVKAGLIAGVSIGYLMDKRAIEPLKSGGLKLLRMEVYELSLVTIPANARATIRTVKSLDLAASGLHAPGVSGTSTVVRLQKAAPPMKKTYSEQIAAFEAKRAAHTSRLDELQTKALDEGRSKDDAEKEEFQTLKLEIKSIDEELVDLREMDRLALAAATALVPVLDTKAASELRGSSPIIQVKSNLQPGTAFSRLVIALGAARGDKMLALEYAKQWKDSTPEVELYMKAAVAAGTTTDATWAAPLMPAAQAVMGEFLDLLRPATILGKLTKLTKVPFNVSVTSQSGGGTYGWVGEGKPKALTSLAFAKVTLGFAKIAGIIVLTEELVKFSSPSAEERVRNDMTKGVAQFMDAQFINPAIAEVVGVNPASITNGVTPVASSGPTAANATADIKALIASFVAAALALGNATLIMSEANAFALATALNPLGQPMFPGIGITGGVIFGVPVITSQAAGSMIILVDQEGILYADDGQVTIDVSREASLQMDSAPDAPPTATTIYRSLWQENLVGFRAERFCTWKRGRAASVAYTSGAAYV